MSRSYQRHKISFGRAAAGCSQRSKKTNTDWANEKARREGKPISKQHHRYNLQTLEDYIKWVSSGFHVHNDPSHPSYCSQEVKKYNSWLSGRQETPELIKEYAIKLYNTDRSK